MRKELVYQFAALTDKQLLDTYDACPEDDLHFEYLRAEIWYRFDGFGW